ncbi:unnamed protein product [Lota lota]
MANTTSRPTHDHSTGSLLGHVMYLNGSHTHFLSTATLELAVTNRAALACQLSFWYQIQEVTGSARPEFFVKMLRGDSKTDLLLIPKTTEGWENATAFIGNQPGGYKLEFSLQAPFLAVLDVMLDDIAFKHCGEWDVPVGSDQLTCDFEKDTCSWYADNFKGLLWKRSRGYFGEDGPGYDHTTGKGYYMTIATRNNLHTSLTARLISYPQPVAHVICVSFWYHIFGNSIGSLRFITKHAGENETLVWMRHGTQGNKWRFADLTFKSQSPIQFIIEAEPGGTHSQGSIAVDDIEVRNSASGSCPAERECTFQSSLCGLQPQAHPDFSWIRTRGTQPANSSGPASDHTLGTEQGFYLSAQLWRHPAGTTVGMLSSVMEPTLRGGECWMFWYYMEGEDVGQLTVSVQTPEVPRSPGVQNWTRSGDQGSHWRHARVTVDSPEATYQLLFEAIAGSGARRDVVIDDIIVLDDICPPEGFCDFEMDYCGWVNSPPINSSLEWDWLSGVDHTTVTRGHFVRFSCFKSGGQELIARLESESMPAVESGCLELWHHANGYLSNRPSNIELTVFVNESTGLHSVWTTNGFLNRTWIHARMDYNASGVHQIILQAKCQGKMEGTMDLDDIHIMRGTPCDHLNPTTTPNPPTTSTTTTPTSQMDCDFERGLCNWVQETSEGFDWIRNSGLQVDQPLDGPMYDHTVENANGFYLLLNGSGSKDGESAVLSLPLPGEQQTDICVGFWYYMLGPLVPRLDLVVKNTTSDWLAWTRQGSQDLEWMNAQVTISTSQAVKVMFEGQRNTSSRGFVAIDDITVRQGICNTSHVCSFDSNLCNFEADPAVWVRQRGTKTHLDHTYGTANGFFMTVHVQDGQEEEVAQLRTPHLSASTGTCIRFWYWLQEGTADILSVHVLQSADLSAALWTRSGAPSTGWEVAELTVSSTGRFQVVFSVVRDPSTNFTVRLDDVSVMDGACAPQGGCDFESGRCTWVNVPVDGGHDWMHANGHFQGPPADHTTQTREGRFLLSSAQPQGLPSRSQVLSEWIHLREELSCLALWYHMDTSDSGTLCVFILSGPEEKQLVLQTNHSGPGWTMLSDSVASSKPFQVMIEAESIDGGFMAVDDISIKPGSCPGNDTTKGFMGCSFEIDTCDWLDVSTSQFQWLRGRNATPSENTGPSVDNTLGTQLGWYMAVEADNGEENSFATLQSPTMNQSSTDCTLHFYYHMYGQDIGGLQVVLKTGSRSTPLWWLSGDQGDHWHHGEVLVARTPHEFSILFEAARSFSHLGDIAIDDISFSNCTLPDPQPLCPEDMFTCNNSVCVEHNRVCDFTDNCGDESDEADCEQHGKDGRCSFEQGLCSWTGSEWTWQRASDAWPNHGPPRDHTQNTNAGHYVIPVTVSTTGQSGELLSPTLLPSSNCSVRFYHFSRDDASARLSIHTRTQRPSGDSDDMPLWLRDQSQSYSWQRAEVTFSSSAPSKIVFRYQRGNASGLVALDDVSFSDSCLFDAGLPTSPCKDNDFYCWRSEGTTCVSTSTQCDYQLDCPLGEDEDICGPCTFERDQCQWNDSSQGPRRWLRQRATNQTTPPTDHTTQTGYYMKVESVPGRTHDEARLASPLLPASSAYCQMRFQFHMSGESAGSLAVLMQQAGAGEATLWSRSHNSVSLWASESLPLGQHLNPYKLWFSSKGNNIVALDDISFVNCETSFRPPALPTYGCSFEEGLCSWTQGMEGELDWLRNSGPTDTPNTGPSGDHTTGTGKYLYIDSSPPSQKGNVARLKSQLLPPAGEDGYCLTFWYHMYGATVGSLRMVLQTVDPSQETLAWQLSGSQGSDWQVAQVHVTKQRVHRLILEAEVGGAAGDIAVDDITLVSGPCPASDVCDFEEGSCNWQQQANDDAGWVRRSGPTPNPNTGPLTDHTTYTASGHYYFLPSSTSDLSGHKARIASPLFPAEKGACVQLWYHMQGPGVGTLNMYRQSQAGQETMLISRTGDHSPMWRFAQASLGNRAQPYRIVVEGVKQGPTQNGDMAFDDVQVTDRPCTPPGHCDFESSLCDWSNLGGGVDQGGWLRGRGASPHPSTGPNIDHTTNSDQGYYVHIDTYVGHWGAVSSLRGDLLQAATGGHCLNFWYHMYGHNVGTLQVYINDSSGEGKGVLLWNKDGNQGHTWLEASVAVLHRNAFWFVFVYQGGMSGGGDVALDDINILPGPCPQEPPTAPPATNDSLSAGLAVGLTLMAGVIVAGGLFLFNKWWSTRSKPGNTNCEEICQNSVFDILDGQQGAQDQRESDFSFFNNLYDPSPTDVSTDI